MNERPRVFDERQLLVPLALATKISTRRTSDAIGDVAGTREANAPSDARVG